jgi:hypothetical protein
MEFGVIEVEYSPEYEEAKRAATNAKSLARLRQWEIDNPEKLRASRKRRYRAKHPRTCKGSAHETCTIPMTGTNRQRCNRHAELRAAEMRQARRRG